MAEIELRNLGPGRSTSVLPVPVGGGILAPPVGRKMLLNAHMVLHVFLLLTLLIVLYKMVVSKMEAKSLTKQVASQIKTQIPAMLNKLQTNSGMDLKATIRSAEAKIRDIGKVAELDKSNSVYNTWLWRSAGFVSGGLALIFIAIFATAVLSCRKSTPVCHTLVTGISTILLVAVVEYFFFDLVAKQYIPTEPSTIVASTLSKLRTEFGLNPLPRVQKKRTILKWSTIGFGVVFVAGLIASIIGTSRFK